MATELERCHELLHELDIFLSEQLDNGVFSESGIMEAVLFQQAIQEIVGKTQQ